jgi:hypothetical protein
MRRKNRLDVLIPLALFGCTGNPDKPDTSSLEAALVAASISAQSPAPAQFEKMQARDAADVVTAQLNFELRVANTGTQTAVIDRANLSYSGGAAALAPQVGRNDLRKFYLSECRTGFGLDKSGTLSLDLPGFATEEIRDVDTPSKNAYVAVTGWRQQPYSHGMLSVSKFVVAKLENGNNLEWATEVPFFGFQDRATAMTLADGDASYVVVGATRPMGIPDDPYTQPFRFGAVRIDANDGSIMKRPDTTLWQRAIAFAGCTADAVDVVRVPLTYQTFGYFIAGNAECAGDKRVAVAMLDQDGNPFGGFGGGSFVIDPGALPARTQIMPPAERCRSRMSSLARPLLNTSSSSARYLAAWANQGSRLS